MKLYNEEEKSNQDRRDAIPPCLHDDNINVIAYFYSIPAHCAGASGAVIRLAELYCAGYMTDIVDRFNAMTGYAFVQPEMSDKEPEAIRECLNGILAKIHQRRLEAIKTEDAATGYLSGLKNGTIKMVSGDEMRQEAEYQETLIQGAQKRVKSADDSIKALSALTGILDRVTRRKVTGKPEKGSFIECLRELRALILYFPDLRYATDRMEKLADALSRINGAFIEKRSKKVINFPGMYCDTVREYYGPEGALIRNIMTFNTFMSGFERGLKSYTTHHTNTHKDIDIAGI